jgi:hypothetical protein
MKKLSLFIIPNLISTRHASNIFHTFHISNKIFYVFLHDVVFIYAPFMLVPILSFENFHVPKRIHTKPALKLEV